MSNFLAIYKRELRSFFFSPLAYTIYFLFIVICSVFFYLYFSSYIKYSEMLMMQQMRMGGAGGPQLPNFTEFVLLGLTNVMAFILLFVLPILTMRLFSEEKRMGTIELLMTYPLKDSEVLLGKFLAALTVFAGMLILTLFYPVITYFIDSSQTYFPAIFASYFGVFMLGTAFMALGIFFSSLTENQLISSLVSFITLLVLWMIGFVDDLYPGIIGSICNEISIYAHFEQFSKGVIDTGHVAYYGLFTLFFLFATLRILESNRWRG
ncbi:MAG: ABC transporter permease [bacterium]|jgi:ABC-2 type transport system permease protein|nr:ABC transporter permease [bacterium]